MSVHVKAQLSLYIVRMICRALIINGTSLLLFKERLLKHAAVPWCLHRVQTSRSSVHPDASFQRSGRTLLICCFGANLMRQNYDAIHMWPVTKTTLKKKVLRPLCSTNNSLPARFLCSIHWGWYRFRFTSLSQCEKGFRCTDTTVKPNTWPPTCTAGSQCADRTPQGYQCLPSWQMSSKKDLELAFKESSLQALIGAAVPQQENRMNHWNVIKGLGTGKISQYVGIYSF